MYRHMAGVGESTMRCLLALPMFMPTDNGSYVQVKRADMSTTFELHVVGITVSNYGIIA